MRVSLIGLLDILRRLRPRLYSVVVSTSDFEAYQISGDPGSIPGTTFLLPIDGL